MKDITWKHVVVIVSFLLLLAAMVSAGKETATMLVVGTAILAGLGLIAAQQASNNKETQVVREQTNGTANAQLKMMEDQRREFARMIELQRTQFMAIIDWQARMLAGASVPADVLALPTPTSPALPPGAVDAPPGGYPRQYAPGGVIAPDETQRDRAA